MRGSASVAHTDPNRGHRQPYALRPEPRAMTSKTVLAERILKSAAEGERDPEHLVDAALMAVAA